MSESPNQELLQRALGGDRDALGELLKRQNQMLEVMAHNEVGPRLRARLSAADLVQQTCLSAIRNFDDFRGEDERQFVAWLRGVHQRNVTDVVRQHTIAAKRAISAEQPLDDSTPHDASSETPSRRVARNEASARLGEAIGTLPESQAEAVRLRYLHQLSLKEIAVRMGSTDVAVASLLKRGLAGIRQRFPDISDEI